MSKFGQISATGYVTSTLCLVYFNMEGLNAISFLILLTKFKINIFHGTLSRKVNEIVPENVSVRARGLPWQTNDAEVQHFFRGLNIAPGGIALVLTKAGRRNGEAVIRFTNSEQRDLALRKHKHHMNQRYIEIYAAQSAEFVATAGGRCSRDFDYFMKNCNLFIKLVKCKCVNTFVLEKVP